jgi:hypothetical protein
MMHGQTQIRFTANLFVALCGIYEVSFWVNRVKTEDSGLLGITVGLQG